MKLRLKHCAKLMLCVVSIVFFADVWARSFSYKVDLIHNQLCGVEVHRTIELTVNNEYAGHVNYKISRWPDGTSFISYLFVERKFRGLSGCGKMLLYSAINDILMDGGKRIELDRQPFDLPQGESARVRDNQLKNWYTEFGFVEVTSHPGLMRLSDPSKFLANEVITSFTDEGVLFLFRSK